MRKLISSLLLTVTLLVGSSCHSDCSRENLGRVTPTDQADDQRNYGVKFLFEVDGVRVYSFVDQGRKIYFTNATGQTKYTTSHYNPAVKHSVEEHHECECNSSVIDQGGEE